jgi:membrane protease YdiL (CAAX protease family)
MLNETPVHGRLLLPKTLTAWVVIALWLPYVALNAIFPGPQLTYALGLALAALGLALLGLGGVPLRDCFVRLAPLSRQGALLLVLMVVLPVALLAGRLQPWRPLDDVVYAPASALAQELYFRAGLLVALAIVCRGRKRITLVLQSALFGLWHIRAFAAVPLVPATGIILATTGAGLLWGLQVQRDRTMVYAAAQHALFLALL